MDTHKETLGFQAEVRQLLQLMIHSLYSNKEIFLRELVSNASDACDKLRFEALSRPDLLSGRGDLGITILPDRDKRTLIVRDNGIGMSRQEVIDNLGTIARSGTRQFLASLSGDEARDANLIGQFGVGFYAAFIVAERVTVKTRRAGEPPEAGVVWESAGEGEYTLEDATLEWPGTEILLHLKEGEEEFLEPYRIRHIVRKYSDHISLPIRLKSSESEEGETLNQASALWTRPKSEIDDEQYHAFYTHLSHDSEPPLAWAHNRVEGRQEYYSLLYIPRHPGLDLWDRDHHRGLKLYVRRVFITDDANYLLPPWLRFVKGVIDAQDLPLNVSREILQQSREVDAIRAASVKRVLGLLEDLAENKPDQYGIFWQAFGRVLKEGVGEDPGNRERIAGLLRFASTQADTPDQTVSLADYIGRMKPDQQKIYYITADTFTAAQKSPHLEMMRKRGIEVLLLTDRVDEWLVGSLTEFQGRPLHSAAKGDLGLPEEAPAAETETDVDRALLGRIKEALGERVKEVRESHRLVDSPACLVVDEYAAGLHLERLLKAAGQQVAASRPYLEVNLAHPLIRRLDQEADPERVREWSELLLDQALLSEGGQLEDPAAFVARLNRLLLSQLPA